MLGECLHDSFVEWDPAHYLADYYACVEEDEQYTLQFLLREFKKLSGGSISGKDAFMLFSTYGFPLEMTVELASENGIGVDAAGFQQEMEKYTHFEFLHFYLLLRQ